MLLPCEDNCLRSIAEDRHAHGCCLPCDTEGALLAVIEQELSLQRNLESLKRDLQCRCDYSASAAFDAVDRCREGNINASNLRCFLNCQGAYPLESEISQIIRRIDTDGDNLLRFGEWSDFMRAACPAPRCSSPVHHRHSSPAKTSSPMRHSSPLRTDSPVKASPKVSAAEPVVEKKPEPVVEAKAEPATEEKVEKKAESPRPHRCSLCLPMPCCCRPLPPLKCLCCGYYACRCAPVPSCCSGCRLYSYGCKPFLPSKCFCCGFYACRCPVASCCSGCRLYSCCCKH